MVAFIYYPFPSGYKWSIGDFILFWLRELFIVALVAVVLLVIVYDRLRKVFRERAARRKKHPNSSFKPTSDDVA
jgi:hypothetical protein